MLRLAQFRRFNLTQYNELLKFVRSLIRLLIMMEVIAVPLRKRNILRLKERNVMVVFLAVIVCVAKTMITNHVSMEVANVMIVRL